MDRRENLLHMRNGGAASWIPFSLDVGGVPGMTTPVLERFQQETGATDPAEYFDYDYRTASLRTSFAGDDPALLHGELPPDVTFDEWGIGHIAGTTAGTCETTYPPLAGSISIGDVEALPVPKIESGDIEACIRDYHERGYPVFGYAGSVYEWSWWLRGMEAFMIDLMANPTLADAIIAKVAQFTRELALASARAGIDVLCFYDDAGMQTGMQLSPALWQRFIKPCWCEIIEAVRAEYPDTLFFLHSCGKIEAIIPDIIEAGFDILHPLQPECIELAPVKAQFSQDIVLTSCISAQKTFPFGTPAEVRDSVAAMKHLFSPENRSLICPSNMIQPETPWENILAFVEASRTISN